MKNKVNLKKCLIALVLVAACAVVANLLLQAWEYQQYVKNYNMAVARILNEVKEQYPEISDAKLMELLIHEKEALDGEVDMSLLEKFGVEPQKDSAISRNQEYFTKFLIANILFVLIVAVILIGIFLRYNYKKDKELECITRYIEEINKRNYKLEIDDMSEDELSILKNEIYKTTVMLQETAELSQKGKENLKNSLSDISHQLKTPLTSILIMLDNLLEDDNMPENIRRDFLKNIKRECVNINFLVQSLLKLSKFDADTIIFYREEVLAKDIVTDAISNVEMLCDLKDITIELSCKEQDALKCDKRWQIEAITNILKNCVEHSKEGDKVVVTTQGNHVYTAISIRDYGPGIDVEDQKHIFERFYKGKNAASDSVGIGLALAKTIIESDNGRITVESNTTGTEFLIKYFRV